MKKEFIGHFETLDSNVWQLQIMVPKEIAYEYKILKKSRFDVTLDEDLKYTTAILYHSEGPFLLANQQLKKTIEDRGKNAFKVQLEPNQSKYGLDMPEEFELCLLQDEPANKWFEALKPGMQRNLIYLVAKIKNSDIKIRRSLSILEHLKQENGALDFKKLNLLIKQHNQDFK